MDELLKIFENNIAIFRHSLWLIVFAVFFYFLERKFKKAANPLLDISYSYINIGIDISVAFLMQPLFSTLAINSFQVNLNNINPLLAVLSILLMVDFVSYWVHRFMHSNLWGLHSVHHSSKSLRWFSSYRSHPFNHAIAAIVLLLLINCVINSRYIVMSFIILSFYTNFIHSSRPISYGFFDKVFTSPLLHHWHHANSGIKDKNFAGMFSFIDVLFGTFYKSTKAPDQYGVNAPEYKKANILEHFIKGLTYRPSKDR